MSTPEVTVSVVSHGQGELVAELLADLDQCASVSEVLLTHNIAEPEIVYPEFLRPRVRVIRNKRPKGFAANHNQAFRQCKTSLFAVLNPDIRLVGDPFIALASALTVHGAGVVAPAVYNPQGTVEDSVRTFPTLTQLFVKLLKRGNGRHPYDASDEAFSADWVAGMFMLFSSDAFSLLQGFDQRFFMYYEDVDICARAWKAGMKVIACPSVSVIHDARRASRRDPQHMKWHATSMARYFWKHAGRLPVVD